MPITVAKSDVNKAGWQRLRRDVSEMEASGVGKALEDFKADYARGAKALWEAGPSVWDQALKKAVAVTKSLGVAKGKANSIKAPDKKKLALEVVAGFEMVVAKFTNEILTLEDNQKKAEAARKKMIASLTFKQMMDNAELLRAFRAHCAKEHSTEEGEAAMGLGTEKIQGSYVEVRTKQRLEPGGRNYAKADGPLQRNSGSPVERIGLRNWQSFEWIRGNGDRREFFVFPV